MTTTSTSSDQPQALHRLDYQPLDYTIYQTDLDITLDSPITTVRSKLQIKQLNPQATSFKLDGQKLTLVSLKINGVDYPHYSIREFGGKQGFQDLVVDLTSLPEAQRQDFSLEIVNTFDLDANLSMAGIYKARQHIMSKCEAHGFRRITFYFDRPDCLSVFTVKLTGPQAYTYLLANGNKVSTAMLDHGLHTATWHDPFPKPSYLFAIVAGDFDVIEDEFITRSGKKVAVHLFADKGKQEQLVFAMSSIKRAMAWDETRFDLEYDLDLFMLIATDYFNSGAMENKGLNIFNAAYLIGSKDTTTDEALVTIDGVVAHEYFHNWTGNRVTCRDWFQLTLKEGLTVFRDQEYTSDNFNRTLKRIDDAQLMQQIQFEQDQGPMAHPIRPDLVQSQENFYTVTVYQKGAEVIRMIHTLIGEEAFQLGMKLYFQRHDGGAATCDDFVQAMQDASGYDLTKFKRWYSQSGTPEITITTAYDPATKVYTINFSQLTKPTNDQAEKQALVILLKTEFLTLDGQVLTGLRTVTGEAVPELIVFDTDSYQLQLAGLEQEPVLITNLDFSAPVKVHYDYSLEQLSLIAMHSTNLYARYHAVIQAYDRVYQHNLSRLALDLPIEVPHQILALYGSLLELASQDPSFVSKLLTFTRANSYLSKLTKDANPMQLLQIEQAVDKILASKFSGKAYQLYQALPLEPYQFTVEQIGVRALRGELLKIFTRHGEHRDLVSYLYFNADNHTDRISALTANLTNHLGLDALSQDYLERYQDEALALDTYVTLTARTAQHLDQVLALTKFKTYDPRNPNRVIALVRGWFGNIAVRYAYDGETNRVYAQMIKELDESNPRLAAGLAGVLLTYYKLEQPWQDQIYHTIKELATMPGISSNTGEVLAKALSMREHQQ